MIRLTTVFVIVLAAIGVAAQTSPRVSFRVNVTDDYGRSISGLKAEHFRVQEDGADRKVVSVKIDDAPVSITILLDVSDSVTPELRQSMIRSAWKLVKSANPGNEYSVVAFGETIYPIISWKTPRETMKTKLEGLGNLKISDEKRNFYDSFIAALETANSGNFGRKVLVVYSDGEDNRSESPWQKINSRLERSDLSVYCVSVVERGLPLAESIMRRAALDEIAAFAGGRAFYPETNTQAVEIGWRIADYLKYQYIVEWETVSPPREPKWRDFKIAAAAADARGRKTTFRILAREGYFPDAVGLGK